MGVLQALDAAPGRVRSVGDAGAIVVGGAAPRRALIEAFEERHGLRVVHAWGMTETSPLGTCRACRAALADAPPTSDARQRAKQGRPMPFVETRARNAGRTGAVGRPRRWASSRCAARGSRRATTSDERGDRFTRRLVQDRRHRHDRRGRLPCEIQDRSKDLIKSGGEWISSVALENALMGHPAVARSGRRSPSRTEVGRAAARGGRAEAGRRRDR